MPIIFLLLSPLFLLVLFIAYNILRLVYFDNNINRHRLIQVTKIVLIFYLVVANVLMYNKLSAMYDEHKIEQKRIQELVELGLKTEDLMKQIQEYRDRQKIINELLAEQYQKYWEEYWAEHQKTA